MRVFQPDLPADEGFEWIMPASEADRERLRVEARQSLKAHWQPIEMRFLHEDEGRRMNKPSDAPWYGYHVMILRPAAAAAVEPLLRDQAELLPLLCEDDDLQLLHVFEERDALDEEHSDIVRYPSSGRIMSIRRHTLREDRLDGATWFKIPQQMPGAIYFSEEVALALDGADLRGVATQQVWPSDTVG